MAFRWFRRKKDETKNGTPEPEPVAPQKEDLDLSKDERLEEEESLPESPPDDVPREEGDEEMTRRFLSCLKERLSKTRHVLVDRLDGLVFGKKEINDDLMEELEEILITSDLGVQTTMQLIERIKEKVRRKDLNNPRYVKGVLQEEILSLLEDVPPAPTVQSKKPYIIMVVGVNGVGKTTTIAKLAARYRKEGKSVLLVAADTFRAAAIGQLAEWGERVGAEIVRHKERGDPSAVVYDGIHAAKARDIDVVLIDTAGRLHTKINLMEELKKIRRVISRLIPDAPHEVLLVLDATTGQNAISQAQLFHDAINITGIALVKLDGTAKGGIVVAISDTLKIPLQYIGIGEGLDDLHEFDARNFVKALF
nr:signal recognition particle-docking protein FtsY [Desulfobacterales bacterium]